MSLETPGFSQGLPDFTALFNQHLQDVSRLAANQFGDGVFKVPPGVYRVNNLQMASYVTLDLTGVTLVQAAGAAVGSSVIQRQGSLTGVTSLLTVDAVVNAASVTVANGALFAAGQVVLLFDNTFKYAASGKNQELKRVKSVAGNVVTFTARLIGAYTQANAATLTVLNAIDNAHIINGTVIVPNGIAGGGVNSDLAIDCDNRDVRVSGPADMPGQGWTRSCGCRILRGGISDGQTVNTQGTSYGHSWGESCHNCLTLGVFTRNIRENPVTNNARLGSHIGCDDEGAFDSSFNTHGTGVENWNFTDCTSIASGQYGFAFSFSGNSASDTGITATNCKVFQSFSTAFSADGSAGKEPKNLKITNATVVGYSLGVANKGGIVWSNVIGGLIDGGTIDGKSLANALYGVNVVSCTAVLIQHTKVDNVVRGFGIQSCTDVTVADTWAGNCSGNIYITLVAQTRVKYQNVKADATTFSLLGTEEVEIDISKAMSADRGDNSITLNAWINEGTQLFASALAANRTVTLSGGFKKARYRITRTGLGAGTLDVGGLKTIPAATAAFVDVGYDGAAWKFLAYGTL